MIVPVVFSLTRVGVPEIYSDDVVIRDIISTPDWLIDVDIALYDTQTKRAFGLQGRLTRRVDAEFGHEMGTLLESRSGVVPGFASREYLLELRAEIDRLLDDDKQSGTSSLSEQLREMADNLEADLGPSEDDREALHEAARLLEDKDHGRQNRFALFSDEELHALSEMTSARTTSAHLSPHRRRMMGQVQDERERRIETTTGEPS